MNKRFQSVLYFVQSPTATIWFSGFFIIYYLAKTVWSSEAYAALIRNLSSGTLFRFVYVLLIVNIASRVLAAAWGLRRRKALLFLRTPLSVGLILVLVFFFLSLNVRQSKLALVTEGDTFTVPWGTEIYRVASIESALKRHALRGSESSIFDYEPRATVIDDTETQYEIGAFPPKQIHAGYLHILNFGLAPGVQLRRKDKVLYSGHVPLFLTPFGTIDSFALKAVLGKFYLNILPTRIIKKGRESARVYDLYNPRYGVEITHGDVMIAKGQTDRSISFDGDLSLGFFSPIDWVMIQSVYDPFLQPLLAGGALLLIGIILYPFSFLVRKEHERAAESGVA